MAKEHLLTVMSFIEFSNKNDSKAGKQNTLNF